MHRSSKFTSAAAAIDYGSESTAKYIELTGAWSIKPAVTTAAQPDSASTATEASEAANSHFCVQQLALLQQSHPQPLQEQRQRLDVSQSFSKSTIPGQMLEMPQGTPDSPSQPKIIPANSKE